MMVSLNKEVINISIKEFIKFALLEIEELEDDIFYVTNDVTARVIEDAIKKRKDAIERAEERYGS